VAKSAVRKVLRGHRPAIATGLRPLRPVPDNTMLDLVLGLSQRKPAVLTQLIKDIYNHEHPRFRQYLTPAEFDVTFAPSESDYAALIDYAAANGFEVVARTGNRTLLQVRATASAAARAFDVEFFIYQHPRSKAEFFAPDREPSLDSDLPILQVTGLEDVAFSKVGAGSRKVPRHYGGAGINNYYTGADLRAAYTPGVYLTGVGQVVGIVAFGSYDQSDIDAYAIKNGGAPVPLQNVDLPGFEPDGDASVDNGPNSETTLDIEMAIALAPGLARVVIYRSPASTIPMLLNEMANPSMGEPLPLQLSTSFALNYGVNSSNEQILKQMAAQGQSFFAASGDDGAYDANRSGDWPPGDSEYVTCVGGTYLSTNGPGQERLSEWGWSSSGGGYGWFPLPQWQQGIVNSTNMASATYRNCPDVAMVSQSVEIIRLGNPREATGTSVSSPLWASFAALCNEQATANGLPPVGLINPRIYAIGQSAEYAGAFCDITTTDNSLPTVFNAVPGYDLVTGWGTPRGLALINALALQTPLHPPLSAVSLQYDRAHPCDFGPIAGTAATFTATIAGGAPPFSFQWTADAAVSAGGQTTASQITVIAPPSGYVINIQVTVTDTVGNTIGKSVSVPVLDAAQAGHLTAICQLLRQLHEFRFPLYINPGDPGPASRPEIVAELQRLEELATELAATIGRLNQPERLS
jgi:subtilase family serine protease